MPTPIPTSKQQLLGVLEDKEIEHDGEWYRVRNGKYIVGSETHDLNDLNEQQLQYLIVWVARDPR